MIAGDPPDSVGIPDGCDAVSLALASASVPFVFAVAGAPATNLGTRLSRSSEAFEWSLNEKIAMESAVGVSAAGIRSALVFKQCGLNTALDPLINAAAHTIGAGIIVLVGDDTDCLSSTALQDSRYLAQLAGVPVLEAANGTDAVRLIGVAYAISEEASLPVVVRFTRRLQAPLSNDVVVDLEGVPVVHPRLTVDRRRAHHLTKLGRRQAHRVERWPVVRRIVDEALARDERHADHCGRGVVQVGGCADESLAHRQDVCVFGCHVSWPLSWRLREFVRGHDNVLVVEEALPFVERELRVAGVRTATGADVGGRLDGTLPPEGSTLIDDCLTSHLDGRLQWNGCDVIGVKRFAGVEEMPFAAVFEALRAVASRDVFIATDVGSSVKLCYPPYDAATIALCLGSSVAVMSGHVRATGEAGVAVIGDYALLHSGLEGVVDMVYRSLPGVVIVLGNGVSAQTGSQTTALCGADPSAVSAESLLRGVGVANVQRRRLDDMSPGVIEQWVEELLASRELHVVLLDQGVGLA